MAMGAQNRQKTVLIPKEISIWFLWPNIIVQTKKNVFYVSLFLFFFGKITEIEIYGVSRVAEGELVTKFV
jgi:hypothetical protein